MEKENIFILSFLSFTQMKIVHNDRIVARNVMASRNLISNAVGLKFSRRLRKGEALILDVGEESKWKSAIDMLFVFISIDCVWLDNNKKIVDFRKRVGPFTPLIIPRKAARYVVELPSGCLGKINIGEHFRFS